MKLSTFRGRSLDEAHRAALAELGPDANVVATRKIPREGLMGFLGAEEFEVTVAPPIVPEPLPPARLPFFAQAAVPEPPPPAPRRDDLGAVRAELQRELRSIKSIITRATTDDTNASLRRDIEAELAELRDEIAAQELKIEMPAALRKLFGTVGVERNAAKVLAKKIQDAGAKIPTLDHAARAVADALPKASWPVSQDKRTLIAVIGPTGAGKTTTAAKIAARAILEEGRSVTLVSCDGFRVGATEQLERFAELLGADFKIASDRDGLERIVAGARTDVVIVDTAGRGPADKNAIEASLGALKLGPETEKHTLLCVPASLRDVDARRMARQFRGSLPTGLVITKLDETSSPAGLAHAPLATKLPLVALCFGQRVPEDISAVDGVALARLLGEKSAAPQRKQRAAA